MRCLDTPTLVKIICIGFKTAGKLSVQEFVIVHDLLPSYLPQRVAEKVSGWLVDLCVVLDCDVFV